MEHSRRAEVTKIPYQRNNDKTSCLELLIGTNNDLLITYCVSAVEELILF